MASGHFRTLKSAQGSYLGCLALLALLVLAGVAAAHAMESQGHWITGMNNQVLWGLPHVFAIFLVLSASGALNVASLDSVFRRAGYAPWARLSGLLAISLLAGGLAVLVLDLGRPERLVVALTHYNFRSVFAWNIFLYTGFVLVVAAYLVTRFQRDLSRWAGRAGLLAFCWRLVLTSGTGAIFGLLVSRPFYTPAVIVPLFIVLSLVFGTALFLLVALLLGRWFEDGPDPAFAMRLGRLLGIFILVELLLVAVLHLVNLQDPLVRGMERFILLEGGIYTVLFWGGQVLVGILLPLALLFRSREDGAMRRVTVASLLVVAGGPAQLYVTIVGAQVYPLLLFPGKRVTSSFQDGVVASYVPAAPEWLLGLGGVALALLLVLLAVRVLPFLPDGRRFRNTAGSA